MNKEVLEKSRLNAEENYITTPISVIKYIADLEIMVSLSSIRDEEKVEGWLIEMELNGTHLIDFDNGEFFWTSHRYNEIPKQFKSKEDAYKYISYQFTEEEATGLNVIYFP